MWLWPSRASTPPMNFTVLPVLSLQDASGANPTLTLRTASVLLRSAENQVQHVVQSGTSTQLMQVSQLSEINFLDKPVLSQCSL